MSNAYRGWTDTVWPSPCANTWRRGRPGSSQSPPTARRRSEEVGFELHFVKLLDPDVILLDLGLPRRTGWDVARELRQRPELDGVRLIALSGHARQEDHERSRAAGIDFHLNKPADPEVLRRLLEALVHRPALSRVAV